LEAKPTAADEQRIDYRNAGPAKVKFRRVVELVPGTIPRTGNAIKLEFANTQGKVREPKTQQGQNEVEEDIRQWSASILNGEHVSRNQDQWWEDTEHSNPRNEGATELNVEVIVSDAKHRRKKRRPPTSGKRQDWKPSSLKDAFGIHLHTPLQCNRVGLTSAVHLQNGVRLPHARRGRKSLFWQVQPLVMRRLSVNLESPSVVT
jgi:hypothetical protein